MQSASGQHAHAVSDRPGAAKVQRAFVPTTPATLPAKFHWRVCELHRTQLQRSTPHLPQTHTHNGQQTWVRRWDCLKRHICVQASLNTVERAKCHT